MIVRVWGWSGGLFVAVPHVHMRTCTDPKRMSVMRRCGHHRLFCAEQSTVCTEYRVCAEQHHLSLRRQSSLTNGSLLISTICAIMPLKFPARIPFRPRLQSPCLQCQLSCRLFSRTVNRPIRKGIETYSGEPPYKFPIPELPPTYRPPRRQPLKAKFPYVRLTIGIIFGSYMTYAMVLLALSPTF